MNYWVYFENKCVFGWKMLISLLRDFIAVLLLRIGEQPDLVRSTFALTEKLIKIPGKSIYKYMYTSRSMYRS